MMTDEEFEKWLEDSMFITHDGFGSRFEAIRVSEVRALFAQLRAEPCVPVSAISELVENIRRNEMNQPSGHYRADLCILRQELEQLIAKHAKEGA